MFAKFKKKTESKSYNKNNKNNNTRSVYEFQNNGYGAHMDSTGNNGMYFGGNGMNCTQPMAMCNNTNAINCTPMYNNNQYTDRCMDPSTIDMNVYSGYDNCEQMNVQNNMRRKYVSMYQGKYNQVSPGTPRYNKDMTTVEMHGYEDSSAGTSLTQNTNLVSEVDHLDVAPPVLQPRKRQNVGTKTVPLDSQTVADDESSTTCTQV